MALSISITDTGDGTGGVVTVAGVTAGTTTTIYRAHVTGVSGVPLSWASAGSRVSDGTVSVTANPTRAYYFWYASNVDGATTTVSQILLQPLTDTTYEPIRTRAVTAIIDRLKLLNLEDIGTDRVLTVLDDRTACQQWPACIVLRDIAPDSYATYSNLRDFVGYSFSVLFQDRPGPMAENSPIAKWDKWRESSIAAFINQRLVGLTEDSYCTIEPARIATDGNGVPLKFYESMRTGFSLRVAVRQTRGISL